METESSMDYLTLTFKIGEKLLQIESKNDEFASMIREIVKDLIAKTEHLLSMGYLTDLDILNKMFTSYITLFLSDSPEELESFIKMLSSINNPKTEPETILKNITELFIYLTTTFDCIYIDCKEDFPNDVQNFENDIYSENNIEKLLEIRRNLERNIVNNSLHNAFKDIVRHINIQLSYLKSSAEFDYLIQTSTLSLQESNKTQKTKENKKGLSETIKEHFAFFLENCPRKGKPILNEDDFNKLIEWTTYFYENNFEVPNIETPIQTINTNIYYTQLAFLYLFDHLRKLGFHNQRTRAKTIFNLWKKSFADYKDYSEKNFWKVNQEKGDEVKKLMKIDKKI